MATSPTGLSYTQWKKQNPTGNYQQWSGTTSIVEAPKGSSTTATISGDPTPSRSLVQPSIKDVADPLSAQTAIKKASDQGAFTLTEQKTTTFDPPYGTTQTALQQWSDEDPEAYRKWVAEGGRVGSIVSKTEKAQALLDEERQKQRDKEFELYGYYITPESDDAEVKDILRKQEKQKTQLERQIEEINRLDKETLAQDAAKGRAASSGMEATYSQGREGVVSEGNRLVATQFKGRVEQNINQQSRRLDLAMNQRAQQMEQLQEAQRTGQKELAEALVKNLAAAENRIDEIQLELSKAAAEATKEAFTFIDKIGIEAFAGADINAMADMFPMMDMAQLAGIQYIADQKRNLQMSDPEYLQKLANLEKTKAEIATAGMTNEMRNFNAWQDIALIDPIAAEAFGRKTGFVPSAEDLLNIEQKRANILKTYDELGYAEPFNSKFNFQETATGVQWDVSPGTQLARGECGEFVNDAIFGGPGYFGDSFSQKMTLANTNTPVVGGAFIMDTGDSIGHVGLVESIDYNPDGSIKGIAIRDSNAQRLKPDGTKVPPKTVDTSYFEVGSPSWNAIKGWFNPAEYKGGQRGSKLPDDLQQRVARANAGVSTQVRTSNEKAIKEALRSGDPIAIEETVKEIERAKYLPRIEPIKKDFDTGIKDWETIQNKYLQMEAALAEYENNPDIGATFVDQALISLFNKITDPTSVVRESEYDRTGASLGIPDRVLGSIKKQVAGGAGLTDKTRKEAVKIAKALAKSAGNTFEVELSRAKQQASGKGVPEETLYMLLGLDESGNFPNAFANVQSPDGKIYKIPSSKVNEALKAGGKLIK